MISPLTGNVKVAGQLHKPMSPNAMFSNVTASNDADADNAPQRGGEATGGLGTSPTVSLVECSLVNSHSTAAVAACVVLL